MPDFVNISLTDIFNHKAILEETSQARINGLTDQGVGYHKYFYKSSYYPESNTVFEFKGVPFIFPDKSFNVNDNIKCFGQEVSVPEKSYINIHLICFNDFMDSEDLLQLHFTDGSTETGVISAMSWGKAGRMSQNNNNFSFVKKFLSKNEGALQGKNTIGVDVGCTYCCVNILNPRNILYSIQLPDNPMLHILSITLR